MVQINQEKCVQCNLCVGDCVELNIKNRKGVVTVLNECMECGHCVAICPQGAVSMDGYDMADVEPIQKGKKLDPDLLLYTIKARRSIRQFKDKKLTEEQTGLLCEAVRYTATAKNLQDATVVLIQDRACEFESELYTYLENFFEGKDVKTMAPEYAALFLFTLRHRRRAEDDFLLRKAPAIMVIAGNRPWDAGMEVQNVEHMACAQGLGVLYNGYLTRIIDQSEELKDWLGIEGKKVTAALLIGEPAVSYQRTTPHKELNVIQL